MNRRRFSRALLLFFAVNVNNDCFVAARENWRSNSKNILKNLKGGSTRVHRRRTPSSPFVFERQEQQQPKAWTPLTSYNDDETIAVQVDAPISRQREPKVVQHRRLNIDTTLALVFFCNAFAITLPVILTPMIAQSYGLSSNHMTSFCAAVASVGIMGGGLGKLVNGIVCQRIGGVATATYYLSGVGICALLLSLSKSMESVRWIVAGMEFFSSAMWVACSLMLSKHYAREPISFARSITLLSLASTCGQLVSKLFGSVMTQFLGWRAIAQLGAGLALCGSLLVQTRVKDQVSGSTSMSSRKPESLGEVLNRFKSVIQSRLFWTVSLAHMSGYLARTCDRMFGPFLAYMTSLPYSVCGGLTASVTLGFALGVMNTQSFYDLKSIKAKVSKLRSWYFQAGFAMLGFAFLAREGLRSMLKPHLSAVLLVLSSGFLSSSVAFQFFQIPNMVSSVSFPESKALCLSLMDGVGFFLTAPIWSFSSKIVENMGWSTAWSFIFLIFGLSGHLMVKKITPVLIEQER